MMVEIPDYRPVAAIGGNWRGHAAQVAAAVRVARLLGRHYGSQWLSGAAVSEQPAMSGPLRICYTIRGRTRMDGDNMIAALEPVLDGLADAGVLGDDRQIKEWRLIIEYADEDSVTIEIDKINKE